MGMELVIRSCGGGWFFLESSWDIVLQTGKNKATIEGMNFSVWNVILGWN
jgi:hypothetical protein